MGVYAGPTFPSIDASLNADNSVSLSLRYLPSASEYKIKVDGILAITTTTTSVGILTVSPGLTRNIRIEAYSDQNLLYYRDKNIKIFDYVGVAQTWTVPDEVRYLFADVQGAQGGEYFGELGGLGGRAKSYISVSPGDSLQFYCGGEGQSAASFGCTSEFPQFKLGGFNGGGDGGGKQDAYICSVGQTTYTRGASGGGASDIRKIEGNISSRIIVAGGGGGGPSAEINVGLGFYNPGAGSGGGENGDDGGYYLNGLSWPTTVRGKGATTSGPGAGGTSGIGGVYDGFSGSLGIGGTGARFAQFGDAGGTCGGGGGGYYGGGGGGAGSNYGAGGGGGGGSGYIDPRTKPFIASSGFGTISQGYRSGNGRILVSWDSSTPHSDIVTDGLILNLDAQNYYSYPGSGTTWTDLSGNGNNGTLTNGPTYSSSNGGSLVFDGSDDYTTLSSSQIAPGTGAFTWNFWAKTTRTLSTEYSILFSGTGSNSDYGVITLDNRVGNGLVYYANGFRITDGNTSFGSNWWYITFVGNGGANGSRNLTLYRNTIQAGSTYTFDYNFTSTTPNIGANHSSYAELMKGNISNVSYYNRALTSSEIQQNFNATRSRFGV